MKTKCFKYGKKSFMVLCGLLSILLYLSCLCEIPWKEPFCFWNRGDEELIYLAELICLTVFGGFLTAALRAGRNWRRRAAVSAAAGMVLGYCLVMHLLSCDVLWKLQKLLVSLWPFLIAGVAVRLRKRLCGYYFTAAVLILLLEEMLVRSEFYRREPVETFYLLVVAVAAWKCAEEEKRQREMRAGVVAVPLAVFAVVFFRHGRIAEIMDSLRNPVSSVDGRAAGTNWAGYRAAILSGRFTGDLSVMEERFAGRAAFGCPLSLVYWVKGMAAAVLALACVSFLLYGIVLLARESRQGNALAEVVAFALFARGVLGFLADLFLITASGIRIPLLGNPGDVIAVLYFLGGEKPAAARE